MDNNQEQPKKEEKKVLKPCCACPDTRKARDQCMLEKREEDC